MKPSACQLLSIVIPKWLKRISSSAFFKTDIREIVFEDDSDMRELSGFNSCRFLRNLTMPGSIEVIRGFSRCTSLSDLYFGSGSKLRELSGFNDCVSLRNLFVPSSVEKITGFSSLPFDDPYRMKDGRDAADDESEGK
jgi:hypothetical protein